MRFVLLLCLAACAGGASAEKADAFKDINVSAHKLYLDQLTGVSRMNGEVQLKRGTLAMAAESAEGLEAPDGTMHLTLIAAPGQFATFRQKSDGGPDLWAEGRAQRIEYDEKTNTVTLFKQATVKNTESGRIKSQVDGELLTMNERSQVFTAINNASGVDTAGGALSTMTIASRKTHAPASATPPEAAPPK